MNMDIACRGSVFAYAHQKMLMSLYKPRAYIKDFIAYIISAKRRGGGITEL